MATARAIARPGDDLGEAQRLRVDAARRVAAEHVDFREEWREAAPNRFELGRVPAADADRDVLPQAPAASRTSAAMRSSSSSSTSGPRSPDSAHGPSF